MNEEQQRIIDRIKKCLALAESDNANEAATALRQAQALMRKHSISESDLLGQAISYEEVTERSSSKHRPPSWEAQLMAVIGQAFGCRIVLVLPKGGGTSAYLAYRYLGVTVNAQAACYTATVLIRQLRQARQKYIQSRKQEVQVYGGCLRAAEATQVGDVFCIGWVKAVQAHVTAFANDSRVEAAIEARFIELTGGRVAKTHSRTIEGNFGGARDAGERAGRAVSLHQGVGAGQSEPVLQLS